MNKKYILDTCIMLHIVRDSDVWKCVDLEFKPFTDPNEAFLAFVSVGEVLSLAKQLRWKEKKIRRLEEAINKLTILEMTRETISHYVEIDFYSQGKSEDQPLPPGMTARNMSKNDLWIAATAVEVNAEIITTDKDFSHLDKVFCKVHYVDIKNLPK
ncbi:MAG: type II toxin-antitoxin system VapC family toxin [Bacteroidia bacterium]|nr:type II toxin-antitoxin system VapC family toxin [Bacteroidia bacterium]